tara:strand:+ start:1084 stop:1275 length:192 start_codon:yes stop_codon:yes gene_type:complete
MIDQKLKLIIAVGMIFFSLILFCLIRSLKALINQQVKEELEKFAEEAKIPRILRKNIAIRIKW